MKILHTSDWHLGRLTYGVSRRSDHEAVLEEILEVAKGYKPHLILHSGDLFETSRPSVDEMQMAQESLRRLSEVAPLVIIAGNHDSGPLFDLFAGFLDPKSRLTFIGQPRHPKQGAILEFPGETGEVARLATLPFVHANRVVDALETPLMARTMAYADRVMKMQMAYAQELQRGFQARRHILLFTAHLFVDGSAWSKSERPLHVADTYATRVSSIPTVAYAAFGHIHKPQALPGGICGRYAGSPLALDFGEEGEQKEVVLVEVQPARAARLEMVPLKRGRPLLSMEGTRAELEARAGEVGNVLLRLRVRANEPQLGLAEWANRLFPQATLLEVSEQLVGKAGMALPAVQPDLTLLEDLQGSFAHYLEEYPELSGRSDSLRSLFESTLKGLDGEAEPFLEELERLAAELGV